MPLDGKGLGSWRVLGLMYITVKGWAVTAENQTTQPRPSVKKSHMTHINKKLLKCSSYLLQSLYNGPNQIFYVIINTYLDLITGD